MKRKIFTIILIIIVLCACVGTYFYLNPKKALQVIFPDVKEIRNIHVKIVKDSAFVDLSLEVQNSSFLKLNLDSLIYDIKLDTNTILKQAQPLKLVLKPSEKDFIVLPLSLSFKGIRKQIKTLQGTDSMSVNIKLRVVYSTIFGRTNLPVSRELRLEVPRPPKIELVKTEFDRRDKKIIFLNAHIRVTNYGRADLKISGINYKINVKDLFTVEDKYAEKIHVKPESKNDFILPVRVEFNKVLKTAFLVLTDRDLVPYDFKLNCNISSDSLDNDKIPFEIEKSGMIELKK